MTEWLPRTTLVLWLGLSSVACEAVLGADFGGFELSSDANTTDASTTSLLDARQGPETSDQGAPGEHFDASSGRVEASNGMREASGGTADTSNEISLVDPHSTAPDAALGDREGDQGRDRSVSEPDGAIVTGTTCTEACSWTVGACIHSTCSPHQTETQPCGTCGTQARSCQLSDAGGWHWSPFSACMNQGVCSPGTAEPATCGNCGSRSRACSNSCTWSAWTACEGEGVCLPGTTESRGCLLGLLKQTRTCGDQCAWGPWLGLCL
jgi:hypothetical protein